MRHDGQGIAQDARRFLPNARRRRGRARLVAGLDQADRNTVGQDLMRVQFRWPVGMPPCRPLGDGLWELRSDLAGNRIARMFFCFTEGRLVALHGFIKKTQKTPDAELKLARKRMRELK